MITDLDDTLYSWLGFYIPAFYAMAEEVSRITMIPMEQLLDEYRTVHQEKGTVEYPYSTLLLPSVCQKFSSEDKDTVKGYLKPAFEKFNQVRKERLRLYPGVAETLTKLKSNGVRIIGFTDSGELNGFYRLQLLGISDLFTKIYVTNYEYEIPDHIERDCRICEARNGKPDPELLEQIIADEGMDKSEVIYMGDSLTKDIYMAHRAGVASIQCSYEANFDVSEYYKKLVRISSWTKVIFDKEIKLKRVCKEEKIKPDYYIKQYSELVRIILANSCC